MLVQEAGVDASMWKTYQLNGTSKSRIKNVIKTGGKCICKEKTCTRQFRLNHVLAICSLFWSLRKPQQDAYLWCIQRSTHDGDDGNEDEDLLVQGRRNRHDWELEGHALAFAW